MTLVPQLSPTITLVGNKKAVRVVPVQAAPPVLPPGYTSISQFGSVSSVANGVQTAVLTYTVPAGQLLVLDRIEVSGDNIAKFEIEIDSTVNAVKRTYWCDFNEGFEWDRFEVSAAKVIRVLVTQTSRPDTGDYEARLVGVEGPA